MDCSPRRRRVRLPKRERHAPSVFIQSLLEKRGSAAHPSAFFACPTCRTPLGEPQNNLLVCENPECGRRWRVEDGLYDFKEPV